MLLGQGPDRDPEAPFMLIRRQPQGLYCEVGDFFIDPSKGVDRAVITHAHADHARRGSRNYLCASPCEALLKIRLGKNKTIESILTLNLRFQFNSQVFFGKRLRFSTNLQYDAASTASWIVANRSTLCPFSSAIGWKIDPKIHIECAAGDALHNGPDMPIRMKRVF